MRLCLACRRLSSDTPLCSHCGRSFGGRLCNNKKGRHLNPAAAQHCGQCGSTVLTEAASSIPLSGIAVLLALLAGVFWVAPAAWHWVGDATGYSHYRDPRVWLIETTARLLMPFGTIFFLLYVLSHMVPGEGGKLLRHALVGTTMWVVRGLLNTIGGIAKGLGKLVASRKQSTKNSKTKL